MSKGERKRVREREIREGGMGRKDEVREIVGEEVGKLQGKL